MSGTERDGRVAVVTGASRGIGLDVARRLVAAGHRVVITGRGEDALRAAVDELGGRQVAAYVAGKGQDPVHRERVVHTALDRFGAIDALVNNVGTNPVFASLMDVELDAVRKVFEINVLGALGLTQLVHRAWMGEHGGSIVNVASLAGLHPSPGIAAYGASKAALVNMTEQLAFELAPSIRVNAVAPGVVKTRFAEALYQHDEAGVAAGYPLGRLGEPRDVSGAVAFLVSEEAAWMTGQTLVIDGGITLKAGF